MSDFSRSDLSHIESKLGDIARAFEGGMFSPSVGDKLDRIVNRLDDVISKLEGISRKLENR